jgi:hypothetical protein
MQLMVIEFARHLMGSDEPNSTEFDRGTDFPVIDLMPDQRSIADMGGTMPGSLSLPARAWHTFLPGLPETGNPGTAPPSLRAQQRVSRVLEKVGWSFRHFSGR